MKNQNKAIFNSLTGLSLVLALILTGCSGQKNATTPGTPGGDETSNVGPDGGDGGAAAGLTCQAGQYADASGKAKTHLDLQPSLYPNLVLFASSATTPGFQDAYKKDATLYMARSRPQGFYYVVNGAEVEKVKSDSPITALEFYEDQGKVMLAVGTTNGLDLYEAGTSNIDKVKSDNFLGFVTDLAARDGQVCVAADGGRAVVRTSLSAASGGACGQLLYQTPEAPAGQRPALVHHVGAAPDACVAVTRNLSRFEWRIGSLLQWAMTLPKSGASHLDLNQIKDKLLWLKTDGTVKDIAPVIGHYDKVFFSDLSGFPDGVIATFTAFKSGNLTNLANNGNAWDLIESFMEIRAGGIFLVDGEIKKSVELSGLQGPWTIAGRTIDEFPHFSLPYWPAGAVGQNRYAIKGMLGLSTADFTNYKDPNVTSLPIQERSPMTDPVLGAAGLFTDVQLVEEKLFLGGVANGHLMGVYDLTNKVVLDQAGGVYEPVKLRLNTRALPVAATRNGILGYVISNGKVFYKLADNNPANLVVYDLKQFFNPAWSMVDYKYQALPTAFENPAGEAEDRVAYSYVNEPADKMIVEVLKNDGTKAAIGDTEVAAPHVAGMGPALGAAAFVDSLVVVGTNHDNSGSKSFALNVFAVVGDVLDYQAWTAVPFPSPGNELAIKVLGARKADADNYHVYLLTYGTDPQITRITFSRDATAGTVEFEDRKDVAIPQMISAVLAETKAYGIGRNGNVTPVNLETMAAETVLGNITPQVFFSMCGLMKNTIYCSSLGKKFQFWLHSFNLDTKESTHYALHQPLLFSLFGSRLMAYFSIDGGGVEVFDLTKAPPEAAPLEGGGAGGNITTGDGSGAAQPGPGGVPGGGSMGGGGCNLAPNPAQTGIAGGLLMAFLVGGLGMTRLRRQAMRR